MRDAVDVLAYVAGAALVALTLFSAVRATILPGGCRAGSTGW
jgi:hypothetical protein